MCARKRRYEAKNSGCSSNSISKKYLDDSVFNAIQDVIRMLLDEDAAVKAYQKSEEGRKKRRQFHERIERITSEIGRLEELKEESYADFCDGMLSENEYLIINKGYSEKLDGLRSRLDNAEADINRFDSLPMDSEAVREAVRRFKGKRKLTKPMVEAFIERITVYEHRRIEIRFTFEDEMKLIQERKSGREGIAK